MLNHYYKLGQLISSVDPLAIYPDSSIIGQFIKNENDTETIQYQPPNPSGSV